MAHHLHDRPRDEHWQIYQANVVDYLRNRWGIDDEDEDELSRAVSVLEVNAFDVVGGRGVYPLAALMNHSCVANAK